MSYSSDVKAELLQIIPKSVHCKIAELAGIISISGRIQTDDDKKVIAIRSENDEFEEKIIKLLRMIFSLREDNFIKSNETKHHRKILIDDDDFVKDLFLKLKLKEQGTRISVDEIITERSCCKKAYLRGAFLAGGSIGSPEKSYQYEIPAVSDFEADKLIRIMESFDNKARKVKRRERYVVYIKDGNTISSILGHMGAVNSLMEFENIRIVKDLRNVVNREVNCDTANMAKIAGAARKQLEDIALIESKVGLEALPENLYQMAITRKQYPYLSLAELGEMFDPCIGKSGVNHRLRKLSEFADGLR